MLVWVWAEAVGDDGDGRLPAGFIEGHRFVVLKLLGLWLQAGVLVDGVAERTVAGTRQGGCISPLLASIFLHVFDTEPTRRDG